MDATKVEPKKTKEVNSKENLTEKEKEQIIEQQQKTIKALENPEKNTYYRVEKTFFGKGNCEDYTFEKGCYTVEGALRLAGYSFAKIRNLCKSEHLVSRLLFVLPTKADFISRGALEYWIDKRENPEDIEEEELGIDISSYEFNPDKVLKTKPFPIIKANGMFGYGILLPKDEIQFNKKGKATHTEQIESPVIITLDKQRIYEISGMFEKKFKIKFNNIPVGLELRWSLPSILKFIKQKHQKVDGKELFNKIKSLYEKQLYFQRDVWYKIHALWDIGTYFFMLFFAYPIFEIRGVSGTGKTKIMTISNAITFNACNEVMVNPSESVLFRETDSKRITKYIDEAEKLYKYEKGRIVEDDRIAFINQSYFYKGSVPRIEKINNKFVTVYYSAYSPTMIGSISGLHGATEGRAIVHITIKNPSEDNRANIEPDTEEPIFEEIRDDLYIFALTNAYDIEDIYKNLKNTTEMRGRDFQIWRPILSIAKAIDDDLYNEIKENAERLTEIKEEIISSGTFEYKILEIVATLIKQGKTTILIKDVRVNFPDEKKPAHKTISRIIDKLGFMEFKKRTMNGYGYEITEGIFKEIVSSINPAIVSLFNEPHEEQTVISEEEVKEDPVNFVKNNGNEYPIETFVEKYNEDVMKKLVERGNLIEMPKGYLKVLE